LSLGR